MPSSFVSQDEYYNMYFIVCLKQLNYSKELLALDVPHPHYLPSSFVPIPPPVPALPVAIPFHFSLYGPTPLFPIPLISSSTSHSPPHFSLPCASLFPLDKGINKYFDIIFNGSFATIQKGNFFK